MILNLAYKLRVKKAKLKSVNEATNKDLAPQHAMYELGNVIPRFIWAMANAPENGVPLLFTKIDLKDGYWRMVVDKREVWNFAYVLPPEKSDDEVMLVIPNPLQMGWSESPAFFCAATETARDVADEYFELTEPIRPHPSEDIVVNIDWSKIPTDAMKDNNEVHVLKLLEVYIDGMIQTTDENEL